MIGASLASLCQQPRKFPFDITCSQQSIEVYNIPFHVHIGHFYNCGSFHGILIVIGAFGVIHIGPYAVLSVSPGTQKDSI